MSSFELINFINYDNKKNKHLISDIKSKNNKQFILYQNIIINKNYVIPITDMTFENIISINLDEVIKDIELTYKNLDEIQYQFKLDINRSIMMLNGHTVKNPNTVIYYLEYNYRQTNPKFEKEILMLSTQAIFAIPFCYIQKSVEHLNFFLSELSPNDRNYSIYCKKYKIDIRDDHILLEKYMRLFLLTETMDSKTIYIVKINIEINLINDRSFILNFNFIQI